MFKLFREKISQAISRLTGKAKEIEEIKEDEIILQESIKPKPSVKEDKKEAKQKEVTYKKPDKQPEKKKDLKKEERHEQKTAKPKQEEKKEDKTLEIEREKEPLIVKTDVIKKEPEPIDKKEEKIVQKIEHEEKNEPEQKIETEIKPEEKKKGWGFFWKKQDQVQEKIKIDEHKFDDLFFELEMTLLENNVAMEVINLIKSNLHEKLIKEGVPKGRFEDIVKNVLKNSIKKILDFNVPNIIDISQTKKPLKLLFVGINGSGKTTTIAKICNLLQENKKTCVLVAADTFRAAAIQQLEEHAKRLNAKLIKQDYGSDPAAVAFDAVKYAESHNIDVVLVDTAGRLHTNTNLIEELRKIKRVIKPDMTIYVGESITGNDCVEQARRYNDEIGIDGIILTKTDVDEKGGAALSVSFVTQKPILFLANGQEYNNIEKFEKEKILNSLGF